MDIKKEPQNMAKKSHEVSEKNKKAHRNDRIILMSVSPVVEENYRRLVKYARANGHPSL